LEDRHKILLDLLDRSGPVLYALLTKLTLRRDIAEELMQELFIRLNNTRHAETVQNWDAYARRAAINLAFDWRRKQKRPPLTLEQIREPVSDGVSPLSSLIQAEELEETLNAIARLNKQSRRVVVMRYIQQQSYGNIADRLHKTPQQVRALCSRALGRLRDSLKRDPSQSCEKETCDAEN